MAAARGARCAQPYDSRSRRSGLAAQQLQPTTTQQRFRVAFPVAPKRAPDPEFAGLWLFGLPLLDRSRRAPLGDL